MGVCTFGLGLSARGRTWGYECKELLKGLICRLNFPLVTTHKLGFLLSFIVIIIICLMLHRHQLMLPCVFSLHVRYGQKARAIPIKSKTSSLAATCIVSFALLQKRKGKRELFCSLLIRVW